MQAHLVEHTRKFIEIGWAGLPKFLLCSCQQKMTVTIKFQADDAQVAHGQALIDAVRGRRHLRQTSVAASSAVAMIISNLPIAKICTTCGRGSFYAASAPLVASGPEQPSLAKQHNLAAFMLLTLSNVCAGPDTSKKSCNLIEAATARCHGRCPQTDSCQTCTVPSDTM